MHVHLVFEDYVYIWHFVLGLNEMKTLTNWTPTIWMMIMAYVKARLEIKWFGKI